MKEATGRAIGRESRELNRRFRTFFHREMTFGIHVGENRTRVGGVDFNGGIFERSSEVNGKGVKGGFAGVVGERLDALEFGARRSVEGEGAEDAGLIHNASGYAFT